MEIKTLRDDIRAVRAILLTTVRNSGAFIGVLGGVAVLGSCIEAKVLVSSIELAVLDSSIGLEELGSSIGDAVLGTLFGVGVLDSNITSEKTCGGTWVEWRDVGWMSGAEEARSSRGRLLPGEKRLQTKNNDKAKPINAKN